MSVFAMLGRNWRRRSVTFNYDYTQDSGPVRLLRLKVVAGHNLAKKDIFGASDPYVKIDLVANEDDSCIDSVYTKTKKRVRFLCGLQLSCFANCSHLSLL